MQCKQQFFIKEIENVKDEISTSLLLIQVVRNGPSIFLPQVDKSNRCKASAHAQSPGGLMCDGSFVAWVLDGAGYTLRGTFLSRALSKHQSCQRYLKSCRLAAHDKLAILICQRL